jgi:hypothetical protein
MSAQNSVNLKLNPEKNKVYRFKSVSDQNVSQTVNGVEQTTSTISITVLSLKMLDATPDLIIAEAKFDTISTNTNAMGQVVNITSANEGNIASQETADVMSCIMNRITKNSLFVKIAPNGKVAEIVNMGMVQDIILKDTASITGNMAPILKTQIKNTVNTDALKTMIEAFTYNVPGKEIKAGEAWNTTDKIISGGMELQITADNKLEKISGNTAAITFQSSIKAAENAKPLNYSGANISYDGIMGLTKGESTVNTTTGFVVESLSRSTITGDLNVSVQGMNMQIPMKIDGETRTYSIE